MIQYVQEQALPKLSETSIFKKLYSQDNVAKNIGKALKDNAHFVKKDELVEILSLMKLNGDAIVKKAVSAYEKGDIIIHFNEDFMLSSDSNIPGMLPFMIVGKDGGHKGVIFATTFMKNIKSDREYRSLMAVLEACYVALEMTKSPSKFTNNRMLVQRLCLTYTLMATAPLEQRLYVKGENLTKAMLYSLAFFYKMIDGNDKLDAGSLPIKSIILDKVDKKLVDEIIAEVKALPDTNFMGLVELFKKINPIRYKDLDAQYMPIFVSVCGMAIMLALENPTYLFLLITSATYKSPLTQFGLNRTVKDVTKRIQVLLTQVL